MANTEKVAKNTENKKNVGGLKRGFRFFKDVYYELKKVTWPSRKEVKVNTVTVLVVTLVVTVMVGLFDWGLGSLYSLVTSK
jgi:preprotein translocase subunit SecE